MVSSYTTNKSIEKPGNGDYVDLWNIPVNGDMDIIDQAFGGVTSLNATSGSATLTAAQYRSMSIAVSGAMSASVIYTIPAGVGGQWTVKNTTTDASGGPWTVTFASGGGGASVVVTRSTGSIIYSDGTNVYFSDSRLANAAGSTGQVQYNNAGSLAGSANLTFDGSNLAVGGNFSVAGTTTLAGATATSMSVSGVSVIAVAPGASGNVLTSNGSSWSSSTPTGLANVQIFPTAGTSSWTKPSGFNPNSRVYVQVWGAGGSGGKYNGSYGGFGGGGGAYNEAWFTLSSLGSTETVIVGAGGVAQTSNGLAGNAGGYSLFSTRIYAYGGGGGGNVAIGAYGGGGGGQLSAGVTAAGAQGSPSTLAGAGADFSGAVAGGAGSFGGGGGAAWGQNAGSSVWGGGGGGAAGTGAPGTSQTGGDGGIFGVTDGVAGSAPGGGGGGCSTGTSGAGGAGLVIVTVFPA